MGTLRSLEKDINEIDEKLRKDEGRKIKIQEELDNLAKQKDTAVFESKKFEDEKEKLSKAIHDKENEISDLKEEEGNLKNHY